MSLSFLIAYLSIVAVALWRSARYSTGIDPESGVLRRRTDPCSCCLNYQKSYDAYTTREFFLLSALPLGLYGYFMQVQARRLDHRRSLRKRAAAAMATALLPRLAAAGDLTPRTRESIEREAARRGVDVEQSLGRTIPAEVLAHVPGELTVAGPPPRALECGGDLSYRTGVDVVDTVAEIVRGGRPPRVITTDAPCAAASSATQTPSPSMRLGSAKTRQAA